MPPFNMPEPGRNTLRAVAEQLPSHRAGPCPDGPPARQRPRNGRPAAEVAASPKGRHPGGQGYRRAARRAAAAAAAVEWIAREAIDVVDGIDRSAEFRRVGLTQYDRAGFSERGDDPLILPRHVSGARGRTESSLQPRGLVQVLHQYRQPQ